MGEVLRRVVSVESSAQEMQDVVSSLRLELSAEADARTRGEDRLAELQKLIERSHCEATNGSAMVDSLAQDLRALRQDFEFQVGDQQDLRETSEDQAKRLEQLISNMKEEAMCELGCRVAQLMEQARLAVHEALGRESETRLANDQELRCQLDVLRRRELDVEGLREQLCEQHRRLRELEAELQQGPAISPPLRLRSFGGGQQAAPATLSSPPVPGVGCQRPGSVPSPSPQPTSPLASPSASPRGSRVHVRTGLPRFSFS